MNRFSYLGLLLIIITSCASAGNDTDNVAVKGEEGATTTEVATSDPAPSSPVTPTGKKVEVSGNLPNGKGRSIKLEWLQSNKVDALETKTIAEDNTFSFSVDLPEEGFYRVNVEEKLMAILVLYGDEKAVVNFRENGEYDVSGSEHSILFKELSGMVNEINSLQATIQQAQGSNNGPAALQAYNKQQDNLKKIRALILDNSSSLAVLGGLDFINKDTDFDVYKKVAESLTESLPNSEYTKNLNKMVKDMSRLAVGSYAPEINLKDPDGNAIALSSLRGKLVLIDFWASWCRPCRAENPNVVRMYNQYKNKGFEIYSVSLDKSKPQWEAAIEKDGLVWPSHVSDLGYWNSSVVPLYNVKGIPLTYLIGKDGKIIAKNLRGPSLEAKLKEVLGG